MARNREKGPVQRERAPQPPREQGHERHDPGHLPPTKHHVGEVNPKEHHTPPPEQHKK